MIIVRKAEEKDRQGIAKMMLRYAIDNAGYESYELDVVNINRNAIKCYTSFGFSEYKRVREKHGKAKGFDERILMRYSGNK